MGIVIPVKGIDLLYIKGGGVVNTSTYVIYIFIKGEGVFCGKKARE